MKNDELPMNLRIRSAQLESNISLLSSMLNSFDEYLDEIQTARQEAEKRLSEAISEHYSLGIELNSEKTGTAYAFRGVLARRKLKL
jgi:hypothetical protein